LLRVSLFDRIKRIIPILRRYRAAENVTVSIH
jgi:hypothetical protein